MVNDTVTLGVRMDRIRLSVPPGREFHGTLRLVVGGIGARSQLTYEQVNELQLAVESLVAHRNASGDAVVVQAGVDDRGVYLLVGPFQPEDHAAGLRLAQAPVGSVAAVSRHGGHLLRRRSAQPQCGGT